MRASRQGSIAHQFSLPLRSTPSSAPKSSSSAKNLQRTGSFKIRGATNAIFSLSDEEAVRGIVTPPAETTAPPSPAPPPGAASPPISSSPKTPESEGPGHRSVRRQSHLQRADHHVRTEVAARVQAETGAHLVHPYDDDRIIAGQATAAKDCWRNVGDLDAVFAPVSGGGLLSGTCLGAKGIRSARSNLRR